MNPDETQSRRRGVFREGWRVTLADGRDWVFPEAVREVVATNPEHEGLVRAIVEADDERDRFLAELALTIFLLRSNYDLEPEEIQGLLTFHPGSPEEAAWRRSAADVVADHVRAAAYLDPDLVSAPRDDVSASVPRWRLFGLLGRLLGRWRPLVSDRR